MDLENKYKILIQRFILNEADENETDELKQWLNASEANRRAFDAYNSSWSLSVNSKLESKFNVDAGWQQIQQSIKNIKDNKQQSKKRGKRTKLYFWQSVAALLAITLCVSSLYNLKDSLFDQQSQWVTIKVPYGEKTEVELADGTLVWLNSNSQLRYQQNEFGSERRQVFLDGEGYFNVAHGEKPFYVTLGEAKIRVYGTLFNVSAYAYQAQIKTTLEKGSIGFIPFEDAEVTRLKPGERLIYTKSNREIQLNSITEKEFSTWHHPVLKFNNTPFVEVVAQLEQWFEIQIQLEEGLHYSQRYTMTIKNETLKEVLDLMKLTTPMKYKIQENKIEIYNHK
ncbi:MAG: DUF4974 domain-containing protein [Carboxylicivirga sp.]|nr:DUF4974 domain-containing protein [Carboxylicivirga sp.]